MSPDYLVAVAVVKSDTVNFSRPTKGIYVGGVGNIVVISNGVAVTYTAVAAGTTLWVEATRVNSTSTTATNMVALFPR